MQDFGPPMSGPGQKAKYSLRADVVCSAPNNGHEATAPACRFRAITGLMHRSKESLFDHLVGDSEQPRRHLDAECSRRL
jgi:hypothetical protein